VNVDAAGELTVTEFYRYYVFDFVRRRPLFAVLMVLAAIYAVVSPFV